MGCSCGKNSSTPPAGLTASRNAAQVAAEAQAARAANHATQRIGPARPVQQGGSQSFALQTSDGHTQSFGSLLEARAERARIGGGEIRPA
jgi:hypothetical protein